MRLNDQSDIAPNDYFFMGGRHGHGHVSLKHQFLYYDIFFAKVTNQFYETQWTNNVFQTTSIF